MIKFAPTIYTTEPYSDASQAYNDRIKAFVDSILPEAFASAAVEIEKCSMVQGLAARMLDYIVQSLVLGLRGRGRDHRDDRSDAREPLRGLEPKVLGQQSV